MKRFYLMLATALLVVMVIVGLLFNFTVI